MKFTSSFLAIALAIGHVTAIPVNDAIPKNISFTYWPQPSFQGVPVTLISTGVCTTTQSPLPIQSMKIPVGACAIYTVPGCSGYNVPNYFGYTLEGSHSSIPPPFAGNVRSYICSFY